ncbi:protoporphyrinogen oxidase [Pseudogracilibacillus auburnensis]|uniref:protoporphyrinogen oxidase n=1 Tax=Pseudogracilibacillus auburnensis TaxID=1494959 RepID=UPI001A967947|nr:protoporphyrinogen oxidase [Pseudogracilibacillus auburnensis]MBO1005082.1 protoporphyrinogen oxidase [Pseudogracilibacillus auburnensis]
MSTVVVIGGGITGLSTMYHLQQLKRNANLNMELILIEANPILGGKINTIHHGDFIMEVGADSIVARKEGMMSFLNELELQEELVHNATGKSFIYRDQQFYQIPDDTIFGIPMSAEALFSSELISYEGKIAALNDFFTDNNTFTKDSSVGSFLEAFLGKEIVEKQIAPILSGVYSGKLNELTLATTLPYLVDYKNQYGSIMRGLHENKKKFQSSDLKKFISFENGMSTLIHRLEEILTDVKIIKGIEATSISRQSHDLYEISFANHESIKANHIVLSTPHSAAQQLLRDEELDEDFNKLVNASLISVYLGFDVPDSKLPADGTGFIVPEDSDLICNACTWSSRKWAHTSKQSRLLLRLFFKSTDPAYDYVNSLSDADLIEVALGDIKKSIGLTEKPISAEVTKWNKNMPKYHLKHREIIDSLNRKMGNFYPHITLAGASYHGVGIADCITNGKKTANELFNDITAKK